MKYLYKYMPLEKKAISTSQWLNRICDLLIYKRIYMGHVQEMKDDTEFTADVKLDLSEARLKSIFPHIKDDDCKLLQKESSRAWVEGPSKYLTNELRKKTRILCLAGRHDIPRMWKEYANNCCGVCIKFLVTLDSYFSKAKPIAYDDIRPPLVDGFNGVHPGYSKGKEYKYENEYRVDFEDESSLGEEYKYVPFVKENLAGIIFGTKTPEIYKKIIKKILVEYNISIPVYRIGIKS